MNLSYLNLIVVHFLHAIALFFLMDWRFYTRTVVLILAADYLFNVALSIALLIYAPIVVTASLTFIVVVGVHFLISVWAGEGQTGKKVFLVASYYILFYCVVILADWISILFGKNAPLAEIFLKLPIFAAAILFWLSKGKNYIEKISHGITYGWRLLAFFALSLMLGFALLTNIVFPPMGANLEKLDILGTLAIMMIVFSSYATILQTIRAMNEKYDESQLRSMQWLLQSELSAEKVYVAQAKQYRHDMRHHTQFLISLAQEGNIEKIRSYLAEYDGSIEKSALPSFCAHSVVNALLCNFARKCDESDISYKIRCQIPETLPISDVEACSVFGNLLENALDSLQKCARFPAKMRRKIIFAHRECNGSKSLHSDAKFRARKSAL